MNDKSATPPLELDPNPKEEKPEFESKTHNDGVRVGQWQFFEVVMNGFTKHHPRFFKKWYRKYHEQLDKKYLDPKPAPLGLTDDEIKALRKLARKVTS